jgi:hypothetical protein
MNDHAPSVQSQRGGDVESPSPRSGLAMGFQKSQPAGAATLVPPSASAGSLKNMVVSRPARKAHAYEMHEKAGSITNTCELPWPVRGDMKKRIPTKPVWMRTATVCSAQLSGCASSWQLANCSPAVACRRAKYDGNFRVPALLGEHPLDLIACASPTRHANYKHGSRT